MQLLAEMYISKTSDTGVVVGQESLGQPRLVS
uniref:Uncharacterized protein n=1 Tax=Arundo donax TaxID=35708 RepID=A0A0A8ZBE1_ARUDO